MGSITAMNCFSGVADALGMRLFSISQGLRKGSIPALPDAALRTSRGRFHLPYSIVESHEMREQKDIILYTGAASWYPVIKQRQRYLSSKMDANEYKDHGGYVIWQVLRI